MLLLVGTEESELRRFGVGLPSWSRSVGFVPGLADFLAAADVVALASNAEGNSNVAGEALLLGLPVATTDAGDHGAVVELAGGRTVPVGDMRALGDEILALLDDPPDPHRVRQAAARELSPERMVAETVDVYDRLLAQPRRNR
jgi:glycosyltransferase involved in cell wall biosynthesis